MKGKVKCGRCGYNMNINRSVKIPYFYCRMGRGCGSYTKIKVESLEATVWGVLQKLIEIGKEQVQPHQDEGTQILEVIGRTQEEKRILEMKMEHCRVGRLELYHQWKEELLTKEEYIIRKEDLNVLESGYQEKLELLSQRLAKSVSVQKKAEQGVELVALAEAQGLTKVLADELIERVEVYSADRIEIKWRFSDSFMGDGENAVSSEQ